MDPKKRPNKLFAMIGAETQPGTHKVLGFCWGAPSPMLLAKRGALRVVEYGKDIPPEIPQHYEDATGSFVDSPADLQAQAIEKDFAASGAAEIFEQWRYLRDLEDFSAEHEANFPEARVAANQQRAIYAALLVAAAKRRKA